MNDAIVPFVSAVLAAACYLAGYAYLSGYYGFFGVGLSELRVPTQEIAAHALVALLRAFQSKYLLLASTLLVLILVRLIQEEKQWVRFSNRFLVGGYVAFCVSMALFGASAAGAADARNDMINLEIVSLPSDVRDDLDKTIPSVSSLSLRLLYADEKKTIVVGLFPRVSIGNLARGVDRWVIRISEEENRTFGVYQDM